MQQQVENRDEETLELKETYSSLQQEVDIKTKKLKKVDQEPYQNSAFDSIGNCPLCCQFTRVKRRLWHAQYVQFSLALGTFVCYTETMVFSSPLVLSASLYL